jgi:hypothetical protein
MRRAKSEATAHICRYETRQQGEAASLCGAGAEQQNKLRQSKREDD